MEQEEDKEDEIVETRDVIWNCTSSWHINIPFWTQKPQEVGLV
jgi:hypothetical protein